MTQSDQRRNARYEVQLPCQVHSPFRAFDKLAGVTVNMSRVGLLLALEESGEARLLPSVGHAARIVMQLPGAARLQGRCVECLGRVIRLEEEQTTRRIAFEFRRYHFTEHSSGPPRA